MKSRAEAIAARLGLSSGAPTAKEHIGSAAQLVATKTWTMGEVVEYHGFEDCFTACQKPIRMFQMMIKENVLAVGRNQKACMDTCRDKQRSEYFECNTSCVDSATEAVNLLDKKLSDEVILNEERIFASTKL